MQPEQETSAPYVPLIYPQGTIFFALFEGQSGQKHDRMLFTKWSHGSIEYFMWLQSERKKLEEQYSEAFVILAHSATKP